jgi:hypothetical protein
MSRKMLKGGGQEDNLLYKIKNMEIDINNPSSDKLNELENHLKTLKTFQPQTLSISIIREIVDKFKLDVLVPSKNLTVTEEERSNLVSNLQIKMSEYIQSKKVNPDELPPAPTISSSSVPRPQEELLAGGGETPELSVDSNQEVLQQPKKLSDIDLNEIGFAKTAEGTFTPNAERTPELGENQKNFIISKSSEINKALGEADIRKRVDPGAITNYNDAMKNATQYLEPDFKFTEIQGGKRTRRHRSKTRNRRTKNKRKKQYKR